jgi:thiosulfate/3-mercaptopyruvate sulfurtransferase
MTSDSNLISVEELASRMDGPDLRILDCRSALGDPGEGRRNYREGHIPGAVFADLDDDLAAPITLHSGRHPLPDSETFARTCERLGISNSTAVVVYDQHNGSLAARAWWMLRWLGHNNVRLLNGGIDRWSALSNALVQGAESVAPGVFHACEQPGQILTTEELAAGPEGIKALRLIDARDAARFRGELEPIDPVAGHIPGSISLPFGASVRPDGTWKSVEELEEIWLRALGEDRETPWAVMCGSGVTACHLALSALEVGYSEPRLYVGSWSEWIRDPTRPIGLGDD